MLIQNPDFSRRMARALNSDYFLGDDSSPDRIMAGYNLQNELERYEDFDDLPRKYQRLVEEAEKHDDSTSSEGMDMEGGQPAQMPKSITVALALLVMESYKAIVRTEESAPAPQSTPQPVKSLFYLGFRRYKDIGTVTPTIKPSTAPTVANTPKRNVGASHRPGVPFKGPSGRWFVIRPEDNRTVPSAAPGQEGPGTSPQVRQEEVSGKKKQAAGEQDYAEVRQALDELKQGKKPSDYDKVSLAFSLFKLDTDQLRKLKEEYNLQAEPELKEKIITELNKKLYEEKPSEPAAPEAAPEAAPTAGPEPGPAGGGPDAEESSEAGGPVEAAAPGPGDAESDQVGVVPDQPPGRKAPDRVPAKQEEVNRRIDRFEKLFRAQGHHEQADWMGMLKSHIEEVGTDEALASLGAEAATAEGSDQEVLYEGGVGWEDMSQFMQAYLNRNGIVSVHQGQTLTPNQRSVSSLTPLETEEQGRGEVRDFKPKDPGWGVNKLKEAQHLPGLEKSEDLSKIMGGEFGGAVTHFAPEVVTKLDEVYGKNNWIVKPYDDEGFAGRGIFFPQFIQSLPQNAKNTLWTSGQNLGNYGFSHLRDDTGKVVGIKHTNGDEYHFGTDKYENTIQGDARKWADEAEAVAGNEKLAELPFGGKGFMAQPAFPVVGISEEERAQGVTIKKGVEGRTHIVTRNGKAEWVPHSTWMKKESLPVVFESEDTRAMAQAAVDAINALPESERSGQTYAPDIVKTADGFKVIEANPSAKGGGSGYLEDNPFIIDSYVSHITGREPAHVRFIRNLLTTRKRQNIRKKREKGLQGMKMLSIGPSPFLVGAGYYTIGGKYR